MEDIGTPQDVEGQAILCPSKQPIFPASSSGFKTRGLKRKRRDNVRRKYNNVFTSGKKGKASRYQLGNINDSSDDESEEEDEIKHIEAATEELPILKIKNDIIKAIQENNVVLIQGETSCGKTTQVPQFLYEANFTKNKKIIGITEPRRITAISSAAKVGVELNSPEKVSYQVRFEKSTGKNTRIKFMTDGVLLKELKRDIHLTSYSVIIVDEAQRRTVFSDSIIGILSKIILIREERNDPLKLVIMFNSIQIEHFIRNERLFKVPPVLIQVASVQHKVTFHHFETTVNYVQAAYEMVCLINITKPPGGILVFLPGKKEIDQLVASLNCSIGQFDAKIIEDNEFSEVFSLHVLPLYSVLPFRNQEQIFKTLPEGARLCIVATNIAEVSITVPEIKYVIDSGRVKEKVYNSRTGTSKFDIVWCSKDSANQRAKYCGSSEGGHCYRLYSSSHFEEIFPEFTLPEVKRVPVDDILLRTKALGNDSFVEFNLPSPPEKEVLIAAEERLVRLGALKYLQPSSLQELQKLECSSKITPIGVAMSRFPTLPVYSKMLVLAVDHNCVTHVAAIVSALTGPRMFQPSSTSKNKDQLTMKGIQKIGTGYKNSFKKLGDPMVYLQTILLFRKADSKGLFCKKFMVNFKALEEIEKIYAQIVKELTYTFPSIKIPLKKQMNQPDEGKVMAIRRIIASCLVDNIAKKITGDESKDEARLKNSYQALNCKEPVFIHPSSILFKELPEFVVFNEMVETTKIFMKGVIQIEPDWLYELATSLCSCSDPLKDPQVRYDCDEDKIYWLVDVVFGRWQWEMPSIWKEMPPGLLKTKYFCYFFLHGKVFEEMQKFKHHLKYDPTIILKSEEKLSKDCLRLLEALKLENIESRGSIKKVWKKNPKYLLQEVIQWYSVEKHRQLKRSWPLES